MELHKPFVCCLDFDGTIIHHPGNKSFDSYGAEPEIPVPYALDWCRNFNSLGLRLILWTSRGTQSFLDKAIQYMEKAGIDLWDVNNNEEQKQWSDSRKIHAHVYVDDNGLSPLCYPIPGKRGVVDWTLCGPMVLDRYNNKDKYYS